VDDDEFLQTSHLSETQHCPFSPSKWQVKILSQIDEPAASVLLVVVSKSFHRSAVGSKSVCYDHCRIAASLL